MEPVVTWARGWGNVAAAALGALIVAGGASAALAQSLPVESFRFELFEAAPSQGLNVLNVGQSRVVGHLGLSAQLLTHYQSKPVTLVNVRDNKQVIDAVVGSQIIGELAVDFGLFDRVSLGLALPVIFAQSGDDQGIIGRPGVQVSGAGLGDVRVLPKVSLLSPEQEGFGLYLEVPLHLPTGKADGFATDEGVGVGATVGADYRTSGGLLVAVNAGYTFRPERRFLNYTAGSSLRWALGLRVPTVGALSVVGSLWGSHQLSEAVDPIDPSRPSSTNIGTALEALGGLELAISDAVVLGAGAGGALVHAVGTPNVRAYFTVGYTPLGADSDGDGISDAADRCPEEAEDVDGFQDDDGCLDADNDGDGVLDVADDCPSKPEDADGFRDGDGCPDLDNDMDGLGDADDRCPDEAEDRDDFEDGDGCPDLDNDGDGVADADDTCPLEAEDRDGWADTDGCPDPDNDGDGVPDGQDQCPVRPETKNGFEDEDGCPDVKSRDIDLTKTSIRIKKKVYFKYDKAEIKEQSFQILSEVAKVLKDNPWITKVRVEGHTDSEGYEEFNLKLSRERAEAVRTYLIDAGVGAERLVAEGFGEGRPVATNKTPQGRARNRRVDFVIVDVHGEPVEGDGGPKEEGGD